jgi:putative endonuclease
MSGASMPLANKRALGAFGEAAALAFLAKQGYSIIERNWRCTLGEIDLIARDGDQVVFVEVRSRRGQSPPLESITPAKQRRLRALAYAYLDDAFPANEPTWRIDVIAVNIAANGRVSNLEHIEYAVGE